MKKSANKNKKLVKEKSFLYYYFFLAPIVLLFNLYIFIMQPLEKNPPFFMELRNQGMKQNMRMEQHDKGIRNGMVFHGERGKKMVALTFDADMTEGMAQSLKSGAVQSLYDRRLIEQLRKSNTPATLFLSGMWTEVYPKETRELANDSLFELGSHSYAHKAFTNNCFSLLKIDEFEKIQDIGTSQFLIQKHTGVKTKLFRFPGGCYSLEDISLLKKAGMIPIQWDVVANDGFNPNPEAIISNIVSQARNGSIIVLHMNGFPNEPVDYVAVPQAIKILKERGFEFVTISKLLENYDIIK